MDAEIRKQLEAHYRVLMKQASVIRAILDGDKAQIVAVSELKGASVTVTPADLARLRD